MFALIIRERKVKEIALDDSAARFPASPSSLPRASTSVSGLLGNNNKIRILTALTTSVRRAYEAREEADGS